MTTSLLHIDISLLVCLLLALLLPLLSFVITLAIPERYAWFSSLNASLLLMVSAIAAVYVALNYWDETPLTFAFNWFTLGTTNISVNITITQTSMVMLSVVSVISFLVHAYSISYMATDLDLKKYFSMLGFFTFSMQGIVLADNLLLLFIFWELVGFSSFMLIGHWMEKPLAAKAASKAFIINRIGDAGFLVGIMITWTYTQTLDVSEVVQSQHTLGWQTAASLCIFCGIIGKSAQFPLLGWLPDAMEGPTPVSALIHAATMVAAGVYLMVRLFDLFTPVALTVVACFGMITAVVGCLCALFQFDIKKILAYSTVSQLGLMTIALGTGAKNVAFLHLFTHAFFKAGLFLSAGSVIHALQHADGHGHADVQDIRLMGGLRRSLPHTFKFFLICGASLAGVPFFSGFLSKEAILIHIWMSNSSVSSLAIIVTAFVSFVTVMYVFRLIWFVFMGESQHVHSNKLIEAPAMMRIPLTLLSICSFWFVVSINPFSIHGWLITGSASPHLWWLTAASTFWIVCAIMVSYFLYRSRKFSGNTVFLQGMYIDFITQQLGYRLATKGALLANSTDRKLIDRMIHGMVYAHVIFSHIVGWFDRAIIDGLVNFFAALSRGIGGIARSFQGGKVQVYIFWSILAIIIFLIWVAPINN